MVFTQTTAENIALEWATRITDRMKELSLPEEEISENRQIIYSFCITAVELLQQEPNLKLPSNDKVCPLSDDKAHLIIDLFLRGVNQAANHLRKLKTDWETRKERVENISWKIFNLAKLLVALQLDPVPMFHDLLKQDKDLKIMMKHGTDELIRQMLEETPV